MAVALVQQFVGVLATYTSGQVGWNATNALRSDLARHALSLDMPFHNSHTPGEMIERIDGDSETLGRVLLNVCYRSTRQLHHAGGRPRTSIPRKLAGRSRTFNVRLRFDSGHHRDA